MVDWKAETWKSRDLPTETDFSDVDGLYGTEFAKQFASDTEYEWPALLDYYLCGSVEFRSGINRAFISLIGYTLPSMVEMAHGKNEEDLV